MSKASNAIILFIAQGAWSGRVPKAPGTAGSVVGALLYLAVKDLGLSWYGAVLAAIILAGTWAAGAADRILGTKDSPSIVIDEIAGFLITMALVPFSWGALIAGFALFRLFDILKPWPIMQVQGVPGGPGVMLDDVVAGIYANFVLRIGLINFGLSS